MTKEELFCELQNEKTVLHYLEQGINIKKGFLDGLLELLNSPTLDHSDKIFIENSIEMYKRTIK